MSKLNVGDLREAIETRLRTILPSHWRFENSLDDTYSALVPVVYLRFSRFDTTFNSAPVPRGTVAATVQIQLQASREGSAAGEDEIDSLIVSIVAAIDPMADIAWLYAEKGRLNTGYLTWQLNLIALVATEQGTHP